MAIAIFAALVALAARLQCVGATTTRLRAASAAASWRNRTTGRLTTTSDAASPSSELLEGCTTGSVFSEQVIDDSAGWAASVWPADLDGDQDVDIVSAHRNDNNVVWYRNDGPGVFVRQHIASWNGPMGVAAADMDGDADVDVVSASRYEDHGVAWYQNDGGVEPQFQAFQLTQWFTDSARAVALHDLDGDQDTDILFASSSDNTVGWFENGNDFKARGIADAADPSNGAQFVAAADIDGDNDVDVLSASQDDNTIAWYENEPGTNNPTWTVAHRITTTAMRASSVAAADLDGDQDIDVLSSSENDNTIAWYENDSSSTPPAWQKRVISSAEVKARHVFAADLDGDDDIDVLSAAWRSNTVVWYENDGGTPPEFARHVISEVAAGAYSVNVADLDGDLILDVMSASSQRDTVEWYPHFCQTPVPAASSTPPTSAPTPLPSPVPTAN